MKVLQLVLDHETFKGKMGRYLRDLYPGSDCIIYDKVKGGTKGYLTAPFDGAKYVNISDPIGQMAFVSRLLKKYDRIFVHSLFFSPFTRLFLGVFKRRDIKKFVWIEWGYDIYDYPSDSLRYKIYGVLNKLARRVFDRYIPYLVVISPMDAKQYRKEIKGKAKIYYAPYTCKSYEEKQAFIQTYIDKPKESMKDKLQSGEPIYIQVGNRAEGLLNHKKWIDRLARYKNEDFRVVLPLSYGKKDYAKETARYAEQVLGDRAIVLLDVLPYYEYMELISKIDILLIDSDRQIALGNIYSFLRNQKKVYLPENSIMTEYFRKHNVPIFDIDDIGRCPFNKIAADADMKTAVDLMLAYDSMDGRSKWEKIINEILG